MSLPLQRSAAVEALLASTPPPTGAEPAQAGPMPGALAAVQATARAFHPTFEPASPQNQAARAQAVQIRQYLQQIIQAIQTAEQIVPQLLDVAVQDDLLAKALVREEIDVAMVRDFLRSCQALIHSVSRQPSAQSSG